jgi:uncharacterized repeat protein (TIGR01451 family)
LSSSPHRRSSVSGHIGGKIRLMRMTRLRLKITLVALLAFAAIGAARFARLTAAQDNPRLLQTAPQSIEPESSKANPPKPVAIPGEILVRFRRLAPHAQSTKMANTRSKLLVEDSGRSISIQLERFDSGDEVVEGLRVARVNPQDTEAAIHSLRARADVIYAEPNYARYALAVPNDTLYGVLWGLHNTAVSLGHVGGLIGADIDAEKAWSITTGSRDVVVGVVDEGIDVNHPDLRANIWNNPGEVSGNGLDDDGNGVVDDINGFDFYHNLGSVFDPALPEESAHGTHVAGIIGAEGNNGEGVVGVNWQVGLMSLKILGPTVENAENPYPSNVSLLVRAYSYAKKMRDLWESSGGAKGANIRVLNNSIGGYGRSQAELESIRALNDSGVLFVAAAGNYTRQNDIFPMYPAGYESPNVISVAASLPDDKLYNFSNVGARTVALSAPGGTYSTTPNNRYDFFSGTSMASPFVAGAAALICAVHPNISVERLRAALIYSGDLIPSQEYKTLTGRRLNAFNALKAAAENDTSPPEEISDLRIIAQSERTLTLGWTAPGDDGMTGTASLYDVRFSSQDLSTQESFALATPVHPLGIPRPGKGGNLESAIVDVPFRHTTGFIGVRATDNLGNNSKVAVVPVTVDDRYAGLYDVTESAPQQLSTGGTQIRPGGDDRIELDYALPFSFPFFGQWVKRVSISTNGTLYFSTPPKFLLPPMTGSGYPLDAYSNVRALQTNRMIAGMWDDLIIEPTVYVSFPDPNRVIFRWEGKLFDRLLDDGSSRGNGPISFETELRSDGTIQVRYGEGNKKLLPVVGISGGWQDAYVVNSHTSEETFIDLTNANTVTFSPRYPSAPPAADLEVVVTEQIVDADIDGRGILLPAAVVPGQILQYRVRINDLGPDAADNVTFTSQLPAGTSFVRCLEMDCIGPPAGSDGGTVTVNYLRLGEIYLRYPAGGMIQVKVTAPAGTTLTTTFAVTSSTPDSFPTNNATAATTLVANYSPFNNVVDVQGKFALKFALKEDGTVWNWGVPFGLDAFPIYNLATPTQIAGLSNIIAIAAGREHAMALKADGTVWSWGLNNRGQLGGSQPPGIYPYPPAPIPGLTNIVSIATGDGPSFAVRSDGTVWSWGPVSAEVPDYNPQSLAQLTTISGVKSVTTNGMTQHALKYDGTVWSWGSNLYGALGNGSNDRSSATPVSATGLTDVKSISCNFEHVIVLKNDRTVWTWGKGNAGELGNGLTNHSNVPVLVNNLSDVVAVSGGDGISLVLKADGTVWFWGNGQTTPTQVPGLAGVKAINAGYSSHVAIMVDGTVQTWGFSGAGKFGEWLFLTPFSQMKWLGVVATPTFNPGNNTYVFPRDVTISCETEGAVIHHTTNGSDPTENDPTIASGASIRIDHSSVLKAKAWKVGWSPGNVATANYVIVVAGATATPPWQTVALDQQQISQIKAWTVGGRTYVYVKPQFPNAGFRVVNWGQVEGSGADFTVDASVERSTGSSIQSVVTTAQIYDLGALADGTYNFDFKTSGTLAETLQFTVSSVTPQPNPIDNAREFVRQQYRDFLNREADRAGEDFWTDNITKCSDPARRPVGQTEAQCTLRQREVTSGAFFQSPEFQYTGYFVYRMYKGALGRQPKLSEFTPDAQFVGNGIIVNGQLSGTKINQNKTDFAAQFVNCEDAIRYRCAEFRALYGGLSDQEYVDKLFQTTGVNAGASDRAALVNGLNNRTETRASVLQKVVDGITVISEGNQQFTTTYGQAFYNSELNRAFVQMEYFGYMKRDADDAGNGFWLNKLNQYPSFVEAEMVLAFISSPEYRARFGQP